MIRRVKCPGKANGTLRQKGYAIIEFYDECGDPQYYCYGVCDDVTDKYLTICKECPHWVYGKQCDEDFKRVQERIKENGRV